MTRSLLLGAFAGTALGSFSLLTHTVFLIGGNPGALIQVLGVFAVIAVVLRGHRQ